MPLSFLPDISKQIAHTDTLQFGEKEARKIQDLTGSNLCLPDTCSKRVLGTN